MGVLIRFENKSVDSLRLHNDSALLLESGPPPKPSEISIIAIVVAKGGKRLFDRLLVLVDQSLTIFQWYVNECSSLVTDITFGFVVSLTSLVLCDV